MNRRLVCLTQPYIPKYRVPLFERILDNLEAAKLQARVFYGSAELQEAVARNEVATPAWATPAKFYSVSAFGLGRVYYRSIPYPWSDACVTLTELAAGNGNAWHNSFRRRPFVLMGHGKGYTSAESKISICLEGKLAALATQVLTYTETGRAAVLERSNLSPQQVTAFNNSTDTVRLREAAADVSAAAIHDFKLRLGIATSSRCGLYVGALEEYKRIDILCEAAEIAMRKDASIHLVVAGEGAASGRVIELAKRTERVTVLGHVEREDLPLLARVSEVLLMPGRVGLIAVDALAMNLPILTTRIAAHAPEVEYLVEGRDLHVVSPSAEAFAEGWLRGFPMLTPRASIPTIEHAADTISQAIVSAARDR